MEHGKILPHAIDLEDAVIGAVLLVESAYYEITFLKPEHFYNPVNSEIWKVICKKMKASEKVDMLTVVEDLKKYTFEISEKTDKIAGSAHIEYHARIIFQKYAQRECIRLGSELVGNAYGDCDVFDLLDESMTKLMNVTGAIEEKKVLSLSEVYVKCTDIISNIKNEELTGIDTGFVSLNNHFCGWQKTDLIILAARPGMGKTALAGQLALNTSRHSQVLFFSLEMSSIQIGNRLLSIETDIPFWKIKNNKLNQLDYNRMHEVIYKDTGLMIDDTPRMSIMQIRSKCHRAKNTTGLDMIVVDYLQLIKGDGDLYQRVTEISQQLKAIAKEFDIPVIALSQLSREVEKRPDKRPQLSDLRESGAIEQDADVVNFLWRPDYYSITDEDGSSLAGKAKLINAKHRNGETGDIDLFFDEEKMKFYDSKQEEFNSFSQPKKTLPDYF